MDTVRHPAIMVGRVHRGGTQADTQRSWQGGYTEGGPMGETQQSKWGGYTKGGPGKTPSDHGREGTQRVDPWEKLRNHGGGVHRGGGPS